MDYYQGTIDGRWEKCPPLKQTKRLSAAAKKVLAAAGRAQGVTASEAGRIIHQGRETHPCPPTRETGPPCCPWMHQDGVEVTERLVKRGLLSRGNSIYRRVEKDDQ